MKKVSAIILLFTISVLSLISCMGTYCYEKVETYGNWDKFGIESDLMPESIDGYIVNEYSFIVYNYFDTCYEIFLDITVSEEGLQELIANARISFSTFITRDAPYCDGYIEMVFKDYYERWSVEEQSDGFEQVGWADIDKLIYNPDTGNVILVSFHANDTSVYDVENIAYFNRFSITPEEYILYIDYSR